MFVHLPLCFPLVLVDRGSSSCAIHPYLLKAGKSRKWFQRCLTLEEFYSMFISDPDMKSENRTVSFRLPTTRPLTTGRKMICVSSFQVPTFIVMKQFREGAVVRILNLWILTRTGVGHGLKPIITTFRSYFQLML